MNFRRWRRSAFEIQPIAKLRLMGKGRRAIEVFLMNQVRCFAGDFFDLDAAFRGNHQHRLAARGRGRCPDTVAGDFAAFLDEERLNRFSSGPSES